MIIGKILDFVSRKKNPTEYWKKKGLKVGGRRNLP